MTLLSKQFLRKFRTFQLAFRPYLCVGYSSTVLLCTILSFHFISPNDFLHLSPTHRIKTTHVFFIYVPNFTLLFISYNSFSNFSKDFQQNVQYSTGKTKTLTQSVHIRTRRNGGHYRHHVVQLGT